MTNLIFIRKEDAFFLKDDESAKSQVKGNKVFNLSLPGLSNPMCSVELPVVDLGEVMNRLRQQARKDWKWGSENQDTYETFYHGQIKAFDDLEKELEGK